MKRHNYHVTPRSTNKKTGPIAVTTSPDCPDDCPFGGPDGPCYAGSGPLLLHWRKVKSGTRGTDLDRHCADLKALPADRMLRLNQAGDLPGNGRTIRKRDARKLLTAAGGRIAWSYTHYHDRASLAFLASLNGDTAVVNLSGNSPAHVDTLPAELPRVCVTGSMDKVQRTPDGQKIVLCPAQSTGTTCENCGNGRPLCSRRNRAYIVGFYAHGTRKNKLLKTIGG